MNRREVLTGSIAIVGSLFTATLVGCGDPPSGLEADLSGLLPDVAQTIGDAWRRLDTADPDPGGALLAALEGVALEDPKALGAAIRQSILDDFTQRRTAEVNGWVLSVTECRLCALVR